MTEEDIKNMMYGSIKEMARNHKYFYKGIMRVEFTDHGKEVICKMMDMYAPVIIEAIEADDIKRSKDLVMKTLKDSKND